MNEQDTRRENIAVPAMTQLVTACINALLETAVKVEKEKARLEELVRLEAPQQLSAVMAV